MICLDSDFLVAILRDNSEALASLERFQREDMLATTSINSFEILNGALISSGGKQKYLRARSMLNELEVLAFDQTASELASSLYADMLKKGKPIAISDLYIGSIALSAGAPVITRNLKDFERIPGLKVIKW